MLNNYVKQQYQNNHVILKSENSRGDLLLGDFNAATDKFVLQSHNIKTIITAADKMDHLKIDPTIKHITYPLLDVKSQKISLFFNDSYHIIDQSRKLQQFKIQKEEEYQYIVQQAFPEYLTIITQSATLIIAYIMKKNRWTFRQSINFVKKIRPSVCPNLGFELQLKQYQKQTIGFNKTDNLSKTLVPIKQNIFNLLGDQLSVPRGSFPHINTLGQITTKTKFKPNKFLGIRDRNSYHQNQDLRKSNLMINTLSGYDNKLNFRQTPTQKQKSNTEHKKEDASRKLAKLIYNKNLYNWSSQNKAFQDNQMKTHKNELFKAPNQLLKRK